MFQCVSRGVGHCQESDPDQPGDGDPADEHAAPQHLQHHCLLHPPHSLREHQSGVRLPPGSLSSHLPSGHLQEASQESHLETKIMMREKKTIALCLLCRQLYQLLIVCICRH